MPQHIGQAGMIDQPDSRAVFFAAAPMRLEEQDTGFWLEFIPAQIFAKLNGDELEGTSRNAIFRALSV